MIIIHSIPLIHCHRISHHHHHHHVMKTNQPTWPTWKKNHLEWWIVMNYHYNDLHSILAKKKNSRISIVVVDTHTYMDHSFILSLIGNEWEFISVFFLFFWLSLFFFHSLNIYTFNLLLLLLLFFFRQGRGYLNHFFFDCCHFKM